MSKDGLFSLPRWVPPPCVYLSLGMLSGGVCGRLFIQLDHAKTPLQQPSFVFFLEPKNKLEISFSQMLFQTSTLDVESKAAAVS